MVNREAFLYSISASPPDSFEDYLWEWPFIGKLPYKGFIDKEDAEKELFNLKSEGYDTSLWESSAISSLGILPDPISSKMINEEDLTTLTYILFHERTHQLFFRENEVVFNENSAVLLGSLASLHFLEDQFGKDSDEYQRQFEKINDFITFSKFLDEFYLELDILYQSNVDNKLDQKKNIISNNLDKYLVVKDNLNRIFKKFDQKEINNAYLLSDYRYYGRYHVYYQVYLKFGHDLEKTMNFFKQVSLSEEDPDVLIKNFLES